MITRLTIHNYALIAELEVEFAPGFSVITGETGAGKSIIMGALQLLMGARADTKAVLDTSRQCRIEAEFDVDGETRIVTRTLSPAGKSRAFIDDEPVTLSELKEFAERMIDIHSQHENLLLQTTDFQLSVLDTLAMNKELRTRYHQAYETFGRTKDELQRLVEEAERAEKERDFMQFQFDQLSEAALREGEEDELEEEIKALSHAAETQALIDEARSMLSDEEAGAMVTLRTASARLSQAAALSPSLAALSERLQSAYIDLQDIAGEADGLEITIDPERLQVCESRLDMINGLLHKHWAANSRELLEVQETLEQRLNEMDSAQDAIEATRRRLDTEQSELLRLAASLSESRRDVCPQIIESLNATLATLGMPAAQVGIDMESREPQIDGADTVTFTIAANAGSPFRPLATLSGGEAARVMLAVKNMLTGAVRLPTIVFDEIDTGVSGRIAEAMGAIMQSMGKADRQVISITHLPQIAARGDAHYRVFKEEDGGVAKTRIERLDDPQRVREIATMLSGENLSIAAIDNAKELLKHSLFNKKS